MVFKNKAIQTRTNRLVRSQVAGNAKTTKPIIIMRHSLLHFLPVLALGSIPLLANDIEPGKEFYTVICAPKPIVLDGNLSE